MPGTGRRPVVVAIEHDRWLRRQGLYRLVTELSLPEHPQEPGALLDPKIRGLATERRHAA